MDRGIPTDAVLAEMRQADPPVHYLVGTPKGRRSKLEQALLDKPWQAVREGVDAKVLAQDQETYVFAQSRLPNAKGDLCGVLTGFDGNQQATLFAHCASSAVNVLHEPANRYNEGRVPCVEGAHFTKDGCPIPCSSRSARADRSSSSLRASSRSSLVVTL